MFERGALYVLVLVCYVPGLYNAIRYRTLLHFPLLTCCFFGLFFENALGSILVFFPELTDFMSSGKIFAMVLDAEGAIAKWRDAMGATDPKKAAPGTIRHDLGASIGNNVTHGSDAPDTAAFEISYFFAGYELI